jgi:uncharacterized protein
MDMKRMETGTISWTDLTVENAEEIRNFYSEVIGWKFEFVSMEEYCDYRMLIPGTQKPVAGICHAQGANANLPSQWLIYITVTDIEKSVGNCLRLGGKLIDGLKNYAGMGRSCVIQDPTGAVCALFEKNK